MDFIAVVHIVIFLAFFAILLFFNKTNPEILLLFYRLIITLLHCFGLLITLHGRSTLGSLTSLGGRSTLGSLTPLCVRSTVESLIIPNPWIYSRVLLNTLAV